MTEDEQPEANKEFLSKIQKLRQDVDQFRKSGSADEFMAKITEMFFELDSIDARSANLLSDREYQSYSEFLRTNNLFLAAEVSKDTKFLLRMPLIANATAISFFATIIFNDTYKATDLIGLLIFLLGILLSLYSLVSFGQWKENNLTLSGVLLEGFLRNYFRLSDIKSLKLVGPSKTRLMVGFWGSVVAFFAGILTTVLT